MPNSGAKEGNFKSISIFAGSYISYYFGAGYATGQDIMQYYLRFAYGWYFLLGPILALMLFFYYNWSFAAAGEREKFENHGDIFTYYCGKTIGLVFDIFVVISCAFCYMVMCSGAAATFSQQFGMPLWLGAAIFCVFVVGTNVFGLRGIVKVLGPLGPILIVCVFMISLCTFIRDHRAISAGFRLIREGNLGQISIGPNLWLGSLFHSATVVSWFAAFSADLGERNGAKPLTTGLAAACLLLFCATSVGAFAFIANIAETATAAVPNLILANKLSPVLGNFFSLIVLGGIYSTAVPLLWTASSRFAHDSSAKFRVITAALGAASLLMAFCLPYRSFINLVYTLCSYMGIVLILFMAARDVRFYQLKRKSARQNNDTLKWEG